MNDLQLSAARSSGVWLSDWGLLVIDRKVVLSQDETLLAFAIAQGSFSAHQRWCFIRQEMAAIQNNPAVEAVGKCGGRRGGRFRGKLGKKADSVSSLPEVPLASCDDTAPL